MKTTILYLHDSSACWMLWKGDRLLEVFSEPIPHETAKPYLRTGLNEGVPSKCPWLSYGSHKVRLVIDPVVDETRSIPAFDPGMNPQSGLLDQWLASLKRCFLFLRSLTCSVWIDDSTHYRRDQLVRFPEAILLWRSSELKRSTGTGKTARVLSWQLTESGLPDFVFDWLYAIDECGLVFTDVRLVSSLFAMEDSKTPGAVVTVWTEPHRCRLITVRGGGVEKVEQSVSEIDARITLDDALTTKRLEGESVSLKYVGNGENMQAWQDSIVGSELLARDDVLSVCVPSRSPQFSAMPAGCRDLPMRALLRGTGPSYKTGRTSDRTDLGSALQTLLSSALWRRRYKQSIVATTLVAAFSGYFVLLALMHAFKFIDLHERAGAETDALHEQTTALREVAVQYHDQPFAAIDAIRRLPLTDLIDSSIDHAFLKHVASMLTDNPFISINSVSWRAASPSVLGESLEAVMSTAHELINLPASDEPDSATTRLIFLAGNVDYEASQQQSSALLMAFLNAVSEFDEVVDVVPVSSVLSSTPAMNLPSDVVVAQQPTAFVLAVRLAG